MAGPDRGTLVARSAHEVGAAIVAGTPSLLVRIAARREPWRRLSDMMPA